MTSKEKKLNDLIEGCLRQDRKSQKALYEEYFGLMMSIAMRYTNNWDDAMEVVNSGFLKIFLKIERYNGKGSFEGWMKRTIVNTALDLLKSRKPNSESVDELNSYEADHYSENDALDNMGQEEIVSIIQTLPPMSRTVFNMYVFEGYKHKEISKELNISEGTSHWHLQNARKILKEKLERVNIIN